MIVDGHAHAFSYVGDAGSFGSVEAHLRYLQGNMTMHPQGGIRFRDNVRVAEPTLWDGKMPDLEGLLDVSFRVGRFGRFEWEKDGERYYIQFFPPTLDDMIASPERMLAQMQYVGVDKSLLQFSRLYGNTNEYLSQVVRRWPDRFRCCAGIKEAEAYREEQILALRRAVLDLGLTALYFSLHGYGQTDASDQHMDEVKRYAPFWEEVQALGIPVLWDIRSSARRSDHTTYMGRVALLHRHLRRYPRIRNVLTHGLPTAAFGTGGRLPDDLLAMLREPNAMLELLFPLLRGATWDYPYAEARSIIMQLYEILGPTKLLWGSDMPNVERSCTYRQSLEYLRRYCTFISSADMDLILGGNAFDLYFSLTPPGTNTRT